jgi:hypothetical protein
VSLLGSFASAGFAQSSGVIGAVTISIDGGGAVACVPNELVTGRSYESGGMDVERTQTAVVLRSVWDASYTLDPKEYEGKSASMDGQTLTVGNISRGAAHVVIELGDEETAR